MQAYNNFVTKLADSEEEFRAAQRLRYNVFIKELGGDGKLVDHERNLEYDEFDPFFDHLLLMDQTRMTDELLGVVGVYRILTHDKAKEIGKFYSEKEYNLNILLNSGRKLLELGRSCLHKDYRGGAAMYYLWSALSEYILKNKIEILFGVASFQGTNINKLIEPLSMLHHNYLAPKRLRVKAKAPGHQAMNLLKYEEIDRRNAMIKMPSLIKAYIRLGGFIGEDAFIDYEFNTTDVCLVLDADLVNKRQRKIYTKKDSFK